MLVNVEQVEGLTGARTVLVPQTGGGGNTGGS